MYALRYWYEQMQRDGRIVRLEIHQKDGTAPAMEIGPVIQALHLDIQGQTDDIDSPIVKTSLTMTFVDAPDHEEAGTKKCGEWMEFYTPDSTAWKVVLMVTDEDDRYYDIWSGFITPDSYSEQLRYRGSVTVIARDNIGHMQDFTFDWEDEEGTGMISLYSLVMGAWSKIESPMTLNIGRNGTLECDGNEAASTYMNASAFEGMTWYDALEKALYSYGMTMRYVGRNHVQISPLRYMPYFGKEDIAEVPTYVPVFEAFATRELAPAVKKIDETVDYDLADTLSMPQVIEGQFTGTEGSYRCKIDGIDLGGGSFGILEHTAPVWPIYQGYGWSNVASSTLFFNPRRYEVGYFSERLGLGDEIMKYMYIAANNVDNRVVTFQKVIRCANFDIKINFGQPCSLTNIYRIEQQTVFNLKKIVFSIRMEHDGNTLYYGKDNRWKVDYQEITKEYDTSQQSFDFERYVAMGEYSGGATIYFSIIKIEYVQTAYASNAQYGLYASIKDFTFAVPESSSLRSRNTVNTIYDERNNVILSRQPEFGPAYDDVFLPRIIKNGIFVHGEEEGEFLPAREWNWAYSGNGFGSEKMQLAVYNHLQLLCYHNRPNNVISGTIVNGDVTDPAVLWGWGAEDHILVSGSMNFLTGHIENAVLRSFMLYDDLWEGATFPETEESNTRK